MSASEERRDSWSRYWAGGALHSCATSFDGNYDDAIGEFWRAVGATLTGSERVLDVATGNGALPRFLVDTLGSAGRLPEVDAVDLADIAPTWVQQLPPAQADRLRFHPRVAVESLPFADAHFDLVISQYGLEYSELDRSVDELLRVMQPGAKVALVLHHLDSLPVRLGRAEVVEIDWLLQAGGLLQKAKRLLPYLARLATPAGMASVQRDPEAAKARGYYNEALRELQGRAGSTDASDVLFETQAAVGELMQRVAGSGAAAAQAQLDGVRDGLRLGRLRQAELAAHALDAAAVERLGHRFAVRDRLRWEIGELRVRGELFGWSLRTI